VTLVPAPVTLAQLLDGFADAGQAGAALARGLTLDSRQVAPGDAFVALGGSQRHGIEFAQQAVARGAGAVLFEPPAVPPTLPVPAIAVPDLRLKLGAIADRFYGAPSQGLTVIGVTGTNGKTSTVQLVAQALARAGECVGSIGTLGSGLVGALRDGERTTPDVITVHRTIAELKHAGATHLAMEVSSHALEQHRVDAVAYDVAVFTNLSRDHLDYHGSMAAYFESKARLFQFPTLSCAVINRDDEWGRELLRRPQQASQVLSCSASGSAAADLRARSISASARGIAFAVQTPWGKAEVESRLLGGFNVANLLAVIACLGHLGLELERVVELVAGLDPVAGRMNRLGGDSHTPLAVVDYAHTPDALEQALISLRAHTHGRLICVFGCGGDRDVGKRPQMGAIAERLADRVILTDDNPRSEDGDAIVAAILAGCARPERIEIERDRGQAIARAIAAATPGDVVLIAGKGHEAYQDSAGVRRPFDDLAAARAALGAAA
jgi:UDP-N-acetylmuramoyl-L-alanyl-D-glutamate--2,6-diaminopimelate ligase